MTTKTRGGLAASACFTGGILALVACGGGTSEPRRFSGSSPVEVCGQVVSRSPAAAVVSDGTKPTTITMVTAGQVILLRLTSSCEHGADYKISPDTAATVVGSVPAKDKMPTLIIIQPNSGTFTVSVGTGGEQHTVSVDLH